MKMTKEQRDRFARQAAEDEADGPQVTACRPTGLPIQRTISKLEWLWACNKCYQFINQESEFCICGGKLLMFTRHSNSGSVGLAHDIHHRQMLISDPSEPLPADPDSPALPQSSPDRTPTKP